MRRSLLEELALKIVYLNGELSLQELSEKICLHMTLVTELFNRLRKEQLVEVTGMISVVPRIQTTSGGKMRALELLSLNQYAGPAPVSLQEYVQMVRRQSVRQMAVRPHDVEEAFQHLVLDPKVLTQLGTAVTSGRAIFLWGPTGTGKTTIAETLTSIFHLDHVYLPHAVEVDSQIITVFDPHVHRAADVPSTQGLDTRWVLCHRPRVVVGGELTIEMLDLDFNPGTKIYTGPVQMKANNGLLIIDDFGRQRVRPDELLNRWVVPLDRHVDYLTLAGGKKIEMPFEMFVVFATNIDPGRLVDEAFLRRIQTKIKVDCIQAEQFHQIFANVCKEMKVMYDAAVVDYAIRAITKEAHQPLRACYPRDLVNQICWEARYTGREPVLTNETVAQACHNYFVVTEAA